MFRTDQPVVGRYASQGPNSLADTMLFVLLTIQQPLESVPRAFNDVKARGLASGFLWGAKRNGWKYILENKETIYSEIYSLKSDLDRLIYVANLPGFGLVKAGFVLQLVFGTVGCLDVHNIKRFGLKPGKVFEIKGQKLETQKQKACQYISLCTKLGGPEILWDEWCQYVARLRAFKGNAEEVSKLHTFYIPTRSTEDA